MTAALRAHRLLCRLGLHLMGRWRSRPGKAGVYCRCYSCGRDKWQPAPETGRRKGFPVEVAAKPQTVMGIAGPSRERPPLVIDDDAIDGEKKYVDRFKFPFTEAHHNAHPPRDGITHE